MPRKLKLRRGVEGKLTDKQKIFVAEYAVDFDKFRAVKSAGFKGSDKVLAVMACKLLKYPHVKAAVDAVVASQQDEKRLDRKQVLKKVADNLHRDLCDLCDDNGLVYDNLKNIPKRAHAFIDGLDVTQYYDEDGNVASQKIKIKLSPSASVQDMAMKHVGAYAPEQVNVNAKVATVDLSHLFRPLPLEEIADEIEQQIAGVK